MRSFLYFFIFVTLFLSACSNEPTGTDEPETSPYKVVYLANRQTDKGIQSEVHIADLDGTNDTIVFTSDTLYHTIAWVGNFFYLGTAEGTKGVAYFIRYDGKEFTRYVESDAIPNKDLKFSFNSKYLAFEEQDKFSIIDISDYSLDTYMGNNPLWHPSKSRLFFDRQAGDHTEIVQLDIIDNKITTLSLPSENAVAPSISYDTQTIAYGVNNESASIVITASTAGENQDLKANVDYPIVHTLWNPSDSAMPLFITQGGEAAASSEYVLWKTSASGPRPLFKSKGFYNEFVWHPENSIIYFVELLEDGNKVIGTFNFSKNTNSIWNYNPEIEISDFFITYGR